MGNFLNALFVTKHCGQLLQAESGVFVKRESDLDSSSLLCSATFFLGAMLHLKD